MIRYVKFMLVYFLELENITDLGIIIIIRIIVAEFIII